MGLHRFGNWAVQRCLEAAATAEERRKIVGCMRFVLPVFVGSHVLKGETRTEAGWSNLRLIAMGATSSKRLSIAKRTFGC